MTWTARSRRTAALLTAIAFLTAALVAYGLHVARLWVMSTEGDVPPASVLQLPPGATVTSDEIGCASGGCRRSLTVEPGTGVSPEHLAESLDITPQLRIEGTLLDPRTVFVSSTPRDATLVISLDYFSGPYQP